MVGVASLSVARVAQISIEYIIMEVDCKLRLTEACGFGLRSHGLLVVLSNVGCATYVGHVVSSQSATWA